MAGPRISTWACPAHAPAGRIPPSGPSRLFQADTQVYTQRRNQLLLLSEELGVDLQCPLMPSLKHKNPLPRAVCITSPFLPVNP